MKNQKTDKAKESRKADAFPHFGDFQKMAEMIKHCCPDEGNPIDCCSMMRKMTGHGTAADAERTKKAPKSQKGAKQG